MKRALLLASSLLLAACSGSKELTCPADEGVCGNACVALLTDGANCGACGKTCGAGQGCSAGACVDCASNPAACSAAVAVACFDTNEVRFAAPDLTPVGPPLAVGNGPGALAELGGTFWVADDLSSDLMPFTLAPLAAGAAVPVTANKADLSTVAAHGGLLWATSSLDGSVVVVDPAKGQVVAALAMAQTAGEDTDPKYFAFSGTKAYVSLYNAGAVQVLDVSTPAAPKKLGRIDVSKYATAPATASPNRLLAANGKVYVVLANVQDAAYNQVPGAHGKLVVVDTASDTVVGDAALDLGPGCLDASGLALSGTTLWIGCGYPWGSGDPGAGLLPVSIAGSTPQPGAMVKTTSSVDALAMCGGSGYAGAAESGTVLRFDAVTGQVSTTAVVCPNGAHGSYVPDLACTR